MSNEDLTFENEVKQSATTEIESLKKQKQFLQGSVSKLASIIVENKKIIKDKAEIEQQHKKLNGELMIENNQLRKDNQELKRDNAIVSDDNATLTNRLRNAGL